MASSFMYAHVHRTLTAYMCQERCRQCVPARTPTKHHHLRRTRALHDTRAPASLQQDQQAAPEDLTSGTQLPNASALEAELEAEHWPQGRGSISPSLSTSPAWSPPDLAHIGHPLYLAVGLVGFSSISYDVFSPDSTHMLQPLDLAGHHLAQTIDLATRKSLFDRGLSDVWSLLAMVGWVVATAAGISRHNPRAWTALGLGWALWIFAAGPIEGDPLVVGTLKEMFHRARPSDIRHSPSFPSGHTSCEVLLVGALLFVLLPAVYGRKEHVGEQGPQELQGGGPGRALLRLVYSWQGSWSVLAVCTAGTIAGRVGADAHWLSDTLAGACLSTALVSGLAMTVHSLHQPQQED